MDRDLAIYIALVWIALSLSSVTRALKDIAAVLRTQGEKG